MNNKILLRKILFKLELEKEEYPKKKKKKLQSSQNTVTVEKFQVKEDIQILHIGYFTMTRTK
jgi:hypothetical protein